jgi:dienelactone hydrolase
MSKVIKSAFYAVILLCLGVSAHAKIVARDYEYKDGNTVLEGYIVYDDSIKGRVPGVVIVHEWNGLGSYAKKRAEQIAGLGYVAFCADIYGKGVRPIVTDEMAKQAGIYRSDRKLMRQRIVCALDELKKQPNVNTAKTAVMGYCFGGGVALELARSGADTSGVVSFHGNLDTPNLSDAKNIKAKVLVLHGAEDPYTSNDQLLTFMKEMRDAKVDWQMNIYANAVHRFTNPEAGNDPSKGVAYNKQADERSWEAMKAFYKEIFL